MISSLRTDPNLYSLKKNTIADSRSTMIDKLIDTAADIIDSIWSANLMNREKVMSTASFIKEILKRSRATFSMLQLALFYLFRIKTIIQNYNNEEYKGLVCCGRRMFLAALMVSSKYLNDKNYRNKTWAKIACLPIHEINKTEYVFLNLIQYQLYVSKPLYDKWVYLLHNHVQKRDTLLLYNQHSTLIPQQYTTLPWIFPQHHSSSTPNSPVSSCTSSPDMISTPTNTPLPYNRKRSLSTTKSPSKHVKIM